jgi:replication initiation and membrane attachment protein
MTSMPKGIIKANSLTKKLKDLIEQLSFIYNIDTLQMIELLRTCITEQGTFDAGELRQKARKYYQYDNDGKLPTLVHKSQPEFLKTGEQDSSELSQIIFLFETTTPYEFLKIKNKGAAPTSRDLKLIEELMVDLELPPAVVNVLIDYVLKKNNNKLSKPLLETIAGQWKRCDIKTAKDAIELAKKENAKSTKSTTKTKTKKITPAEKPEWFDKKIEKEEMNQDELNEMEELLKDFR